MLKVLRSICRKLWYLFACKKLISSPTHFLNCWKGKANLLLWELWECLTIAINNCSINLEETFMLICMQKVNFITYFFLKILQRSSKLNILGNLGLPGPSKMIVSIWRNFWCYLQVKNQLQSSRVPRDIGKLSQTCYFGYFGQNWLRIPKVILPPCRKLLYLSAGKKATWSPMFFWRHCKDMQTFYFGYFGNVWLLTSKMIISTSRKLWYFSACQR